MAQSVCRDGPECGILGPIRVEQAFVPRGRDRNLRMSHERELDRSADAREILPEDDEMQHAKCRTDDSEARTTTASVQTIQCVRTRSLSPGLRARPRGRGHAGEATRCCCRTCVSEGEAMFICQRVLTVSRGKMRVVGGESRGWWGGPGPTRLVAMWLAGADGAVGLRENHFA